MDIISMITSMDTLTLVIILLFITVFKGLALWKAAMLKEKAWFWCLLIFNTLGVLPIIYLIIKKSRRI